VTTPNFRDRLTRVKEQQEDSRTPRQRLWDWLKAEGRHQQSHRTVTRSPIPKLARVTGPCPCGHTWKHHKKSGRCRPSCDCVLGAQR
jgi:hypothetical protein